MQQELSTWNEEVCVLHSKETLNNQCVMCFAPSLPLSPSHHTLRAREHGEMEQNCP